MSNFTSSFISTADIGSWDYYIFSDNVGIWRSLNGLAAWFNSSGSMLQGAALLGSLIVLTMILFGASVHKSSVGAGTLGTWFFFMSMMGITGQANVYNIYTNQVTVVQNIPALALVPASVFSKAAYKVFLTMDTAFQGVNGSYMSVSQYGFVGPLDVLLALRSPKSIAPMAFLNQTLSQVVHDCAVDPNNGAAPATPMNSSLDTLTWFLTNGRNSTGLTKIFDAANQNGATASCGTAWIYVDAEYTKLANGSPIAMKMINAGTTKQNPQDPNGKWTTPSLKGSFDMIIDAAVGMQQSAVEYTKNALTASTIQYAIECLNQSGAITTPENCSNSALAQADMMEKWKTDAASAGSGFLKTMFTSMGVLQALFFALFPVIALYGLIVVSNTAKVFGGYIFFGVWCQSWLLVVAPVQSYIQTSIVDEVTKIIGTDHGMSLGNSTALYQMLSTKLAIAGDIMASSQMLSLALLSGSMVALSGLAQKWSGEQHMDSSKLQNDISKSAPLVNNVAPRTNEQFIDSAGAVTSATTGTGAGNFSLTMLSNNGDTEAASTAIRSSSAQGRSHDITDAVQQSAGVKLTKGQRSKIANSLDVGFQQTGQMGALVAEGMAGDIFKDINLGKKAKEAAIGTFKKAEGMAVEQLAAANPSIMGDLFGADSEKKIAAWADVGDKALMIASAGVLAAEIASGVGFAAAPATIAAISGFAARRVAAKGASTLAKSVATKAVSKGGLTANAAVLSAANLVGGASNVASAIAGDTRAFGAAIIRQSAQRSDETEVGKSTEKSKTFNTQDADKLSKSWEASQSKSAENGTSAGQSQTFITSFDRNQMIASLNSSSPEQRQNARMVAASLRQARAPGETDEHLDARNKSADFKTDMAVQLLQMSGAGADEKNEHLRNVLFINSKAGQVSSSLLNIPGSNPMQPDYKPNISNVAPTSPTQGRWVKDQNFKPTAGQSAPTSIDMSHNGWGTVDGGDPKNAQHVANAAKQGYHWVKPTPGSEGGSYLVNPIDTARNNISSHPTQTAPLGSLINEHSGDAFANRGARATEDIYSNVESTKDRIGKVATSEVADLNEKRDAAGGVIRQATGVQMGNDALKLTSKLTKIGGGGGHDIKPTKQVHSDSD